MIDVTNLRYDHVSFDGYDRPTTPNIDALARDSLDFTEAYSHASWTLPEFITLMTGLYPYQHGVMDRDNGSSLSSKADTLPDALARAGYRTFIAAGLFDHQPSEGMITRFETRIACLNPNFPPDDDHHLYGYFNCTVPQAETWLKENASQKFFMHVQGFDAHCPFSQAGGKTYDPTYQGSVDFSSCLETYSKVQPVLKNGVRYFPVYSKNSATKILINDRDVRHLVAIYDEAITSADREVGDLIQNLKNLGLYNKTIVVVTSEHGDLFGEHGRFMRGGPIRGTFYDEVLHVPLFIHIPGVKPARVTGLVGQVDFAPTLLDILGLPKLQGAAGHSVVPLIESGHLVNHYIYAGSTFNSQPDNFYFGYDSRLETVRNQNWKLLMETVHQPSGDVVTKELYHISHDPHELINVASERPDILNIMEDNLSSWSKATRQWP